MRHAARAFTLVELLVVVAIIATLASMLLPTVFSVYGLAREAACKGNLRLLSAATKAFFGENGDRLPRNDISVAAAKEWLTKSSSRTWDPEEVLPGSNSTVQWWCNKIYPYSVKTLSSYICPSDADRTTPELPAQTSYGFNNTLTNPTAAGGDEVETVFQIKNPENTALIGHCGIFLREPAIVEDMADAGAPTNWPVGHMPEFDRVARISLGRCGFAVASGNVVVLTFAEAQKVKSATSPAKLMLFHKE